MTPSPPQPGDGSGGRVPWKPPFTDDGRLRTPFLIGFGRSRTVSRPQPLVPDPRTHLCDWSDAGSGRRVVPVDQPDGYSSLPTSQWSGATILSVRRGPPAFHPLPGWPLRGCRTHPCVSDDQDPSRVGRGPPCCREGFRRPVDGCVTSSRGRTGWDVLEGCRRDGSRLRLGWSRGGSRCASEESQGSVWSGTGGGRDEPVRGRTSWGCGTGRGRGRRSTSSNRDFLT